VQEFHRGIRARQRLYGESALLALGRLIGRNRRRYGGYLVHVAIVVYFVGFTGSSFKVTREATLRVGESTEVRSPYGHTYRLTHLGISQYQALNRQVSAATLEVRRDGRRIGTVVSEKRQHVDSFGRPTFQPSTEVGILGGVREDLYVVFAGSVDLTERASFAITVNPLVWWVWFAGVLLVFGGLITLWPGGPGTPVAAPKAPARVAPELAGVP
jgi:cytochrome c-type biogenesis protein CcmF